jgi:CRP-like cAMP-binding protein
MNDQEKVALLRASGLFDWADLRMGALLPLFDEVAVRARECVAVEGAPCHQFFVVASGCLETFRGDRAELLRAGDGFGWKAMDDRGPNEATVIAATDATLLVLGHAQFGAASAPPPNRRIFGWALPSALGVPASSRPRASGA